MIIYSHRVRTKRNVIPTELAKCMIFFSSILSVIHIVTITESFVHCTIHIIHIIISRDICSMIVFVFLDFLLPHVMKPCFLLQTHLLRFGPVILFPSTYLIYYLSSFLNDSSPHLTSNRRKIYIKSPLHVYNRTLHYSFICILIIHACIHTT